MLRVFGRPAGPARLTAARARRRHDASGLMSIWGSHWCRRG
jgi:hypothetical protein